ncbi:MAG: TetR/AcrR family transcriptional regulator [Myxococcales bacterium]|nr:TetR/AcrR family transcriptional regulator [Myxococcales bacterium]
MEAEDGSGRELGLRERKKAALRQRIAETTIELVRERGLDGATVEEIVRRVEISQPTFYNYFPSKEAVLAEYATRGWGPLLAAMANHPGDVVARLRDYFQEIARDVERDGLLWHAIAVSGAYNPVRNPELLESAEAGTRVLESVLAEGQRRGELTARVPAQLMASVIEGIMLRAVIEWAAGFPERAPLGKRMDAMFGFFMRGAGRGADEPAPCGDDRAG